MVKEIDSLRKDYGFIIGETNPNLSICIHCGASYNHNTNGELRLSAKMKRHATQIHKIGS